MRRKTAASDRSDPQTHDAGNDGHAALLALPITDPYDITTPFDSVCGLTRRKGKGEEIDRKIARRKLSRVTAPSRYFTSGKECDRLRSRKGGDLQQQVLSRILTAFPINSDRRGLPLRKP